MSGFTRSKRLLIMLCMCSVLVTVIAQSTLGTHEGTESGHSHNGGQVRNTENFNPQPGSNHGSSDPESNPAKQNTLTRATGLGGSPSPAPRTGPITPTKQPFHVLAEDLEYFDYKDESKEEVAGARAANENDVTSNICNTTKQEDTLKDDCNCQRPTDGPVTSTTTTTTTTTAAPQLDEIAELQEVMKKICTRFRERLENSARRKENVIDRVEDDCSVTLSYNFESTVLRRSPSRKEWQRVYPWDGMTTTSKISGKFQRQNGGRTNPWSHTPESYRTQSVNGRYYKYIEDMKTTVKNFENRIDNDFG